MDSKTKESPKTKDALKQLQAEVRQLQSLVAGRDGRPPEGDAPDEPPPPAPVTGKVKDAIKDAAVSYTLQRPALGEGDAPFVTGLVAVTWAQAARATDEAVALLGYALSSPQKVSLLRALLGRDGESAAALGATTQLSTGSLYHHLRDLMHAGLIRQAGRNQYQISARGQRVLLLLLALAVEGE